MKRNSLLFLPVGPRQRQKMRCQRRDLNVILTPVCHTLVKNISFSHHRLQIHNEKQPLNIIKGSYWRRQEKVIWQR